MVNGTADTNEQTNQRRPLYKQIYFWVLVGIVLGILVGYFFPSTGQSLEPLGNTFINLIKMVIPPVIFCTVVAGIAGMGSLRSAGRIGVKALVYFEVLTTVALVLGLIVINVVRPGEGVNADPSGIEVNSTVSGYISKGESSHWYDFISTSYRTARWARSPMVTSCRFCSSRFCSPSHCTLWVIEASRSYGVSSG